MGILSDIVNGIAEIFSPSDDVTCACCQKCKREHRSGDYKRVFICTAEQYVYKLGMPVLATKVEDIYRCYPPCYKNKLYNLFEPCHPENPTMPSDEIIDWNDVENDWDPNQKEQDSSVSPDDYYQQY